MYNIVTIERSHNYSQLYFHEMVLCEMRENIASRKRASAVLIMILIALLECLNVTDSAANGGAGRGNNYASLECGAKVIATNEEASVSGVLLLGMVTMQW